MSGLGTNFWVRLVLAYVTKNVKPGKINDCSVFQSPGKLVIVARLKAGQTDGYLRLLSSGATRTILFMKSAAENNLSHLNRAVL